MWLLYFSIYFQKKKGYRDYLKSEFKKIGNSDFNEIYIYYMAQSLLFWVDCF